MIEEANKPAAVEIEFILGHTFEDIDSWFKTNFKTNPQRVTGVEIDFDSGDDGDIPDLISNDALNSQTLCTVSDLSIYDYKDNTLSELLSPVDDKNDRNVDNLSEEPEKFK
jgi:hypothetical protein